MANANAPYGLSPVRTVSGQVYTGAARTYSILSTNATNLFIGDPVIVAGTADANGVPNVVRATGGSGNFVTGVIVGFLTAYPNNTSAPNLNITYWPTSTAGYAMVCDDPDMLYSVQASGAIAITDMSNNANITLSTAGSTVTGYSGAMLDSASIGTAATKQLRIIEVAQLPNNEIGNYTQVLVKLNTSSQTNTTGV